MQTLPLTGASPRATAPRRGGSFRTLAENSPDLIARLDAGLRLLYVNRAGASIIGRPAEELQGRTPADGLMPEPIVGALTAAARRARRLRREAPLRFAVGDGAGMRHFSGRVIPEFGRGARPETLLVIAYDVTRAMETHAEREALLEREKRARGDAEAAARARDQFLAIVSHELRSPLNGIQSWAHVLEQQLKDKGPVCQRALAGIRTGVEQQVRLIEDLLDATRIIGGQLRLDRQPFPLRPIIEAALESVQAAAAAKHVHVISDLRLADEQVNGDPDRVQQILWNLLDNSVKFTPGGGHVWLTARREDPMVLMTVRDDGKGIEAHFLPHLFDPFRQAESASTRRHQGLGLGLALVRHLTELHGGRVRASSGGVLGRSGAIFEVRLPLHHAVLRAAMSEDADIDAPLPSLAGITVMLVDDQAEVRESVAALLGGAGAHVITAASGRAALARLDERGPSGLPDLLLCDLAMPDQDGFQTLRCVRAWEEQHGVARAHQMPAVALTAFALREHRIRALASGYRMHLTKPVAPAELILVVATMAGKIRAGNAGSQLR